jgi:hypothetical protein
MCTHPQSLRCQQSECPRSSLQRPDRPAIKLLYIFEKEIASSNLYLIKKYGLTVLLFAQLEEKGIVSSLTSAYLLHKAATLL